MLKKIILWLIVLGTFAFLSAQNISSDTLMYHHIRYDQQGHILPWYSDNPGVAYDQTVRLVWNFWKNMEIDSNGAPYYMNHQVWKPEHDPRGLGGDQINMALSSWSLLYRYLGDESVRQNMIFMADYYLDHSLSPANAQWPDLPYPYNTTIHGHRYDGDMVSGKGYLQPDKAGTFAGELVALFKMTGNRRYLNAAIKIANTLSAKVEAGDGERSPWPFRVHALSGQVAEQYDPKKIEKKLACYTSNWVGTLQLFAELITMKQGRSEAYQKAYDLTLKWMLQYPLKTNKWGPFFEDIGAWSDTQVNAVTFAMYLLEHPEISPTWQGDVRSIFDWVYKELGNRTWEKWGVVVVNEQTAYRVPGNSHTSRQAATELLYGEKTGDLCYKENAIRALSWATYMVDVDGKNRYVRNDIWLTDGYGDYVRHYLRAMAAEPELAPAGNHLLRSSSIVAAIHYAEQEIRYTTYDACSQELLRLVDKPGTVYVEHQVLAAKGEGAQSGWTWQPLASGGVLRIYKNSGKNVRIVKSPMR
jgi:hypothetical protein